MFRLVMTVLCLAVRVGHADSTPQPESPSPATEDLGETAKGHGSVSIAYLNTYSNGFQINTNTTKPLATVRSRGIALDVDYNVTDDLSVHLGIPYIDNRFVKGIPHCPTTAPPQCAGLPALNPQHPESQFLDDGKYHGTWQDFNLGAAWHTHIGNYYITPSITAVIPSHDYTFFANAAVGQRLRQLELAATLAHQFDFSNIYYKLGYAYVLSQRILGHDTGYQRFDAELGYFVNEKLSVRTFTTGRLGDGLAALDLLALTDGQTNAYWYHHDQLAKHSYFGAGLGFDYALGKRYTLTTGIQREVWGETVFNFKYALEMRLTRSF
jgi:hypothetical protein